MSVWVRIPRGQGGVEVLLYMSVVYGQSEHQTFCGGVVGGVMLREKTVRLVQIVPNHIFVVEFFDDVVADDLWSVVCGRFVVVAQFEMFMMLEIIVCIGSYCFDIIFR
jgi:hypothetical protein